MSDGLTPDGKSFLRNIEDEKVWSLIRETLDKTGLDLSYRCSRRCARQSSSAT